MKQPQNLTSYGLLVIVPREGLQCAYCFLVDNSKILCWRIMVSSCIFQIYSKICCTKVRNNHVLRDHFNLNLDKPK